MLPVMDNSSEADDDRRGVKRKIALSSCDVCETEEAKYRCPSCKKHTCSLACVKQHKMVSGCCGVRDKTTFVPLAEFDEINLLNDYRFLEDTARLSQQSNRDAVLLGSRRHPKEGMWMIRRARAAKVTLKFLPKIFSKHRENRTVFRRAEGRFHWHLKIHFPQSNAVYSERFPDDKRLDQILNEYIHPSESDPVKRQKLQLYVHSPHEDIRVFLKAEQKLHNSLRFLELDLKKSLQENLMHKTIVEYPEVFVVLKRHSQEFLAHTPERSSASVSSSPDKPRSEVSKRPKVVPEDEELEDGELRSDQEEDNTEDDEGNLPETESKVPVTHHEDDEGDEEELHSSVLEAKTNHEMMKVSGDDDDGQDCTDEDNKSSVSQNLPGLPDENINGDGVAQHETDESPSSSCDCSDASKTEGQENTHNASNIYSNESHICADVTLV
ncbi:box C/D snoRNA protein 1 [Rhinichthys klamathensis goyatoka]|uniref:box C/D snoRNA protein 1 n=1 Tax=Rhinichthys klamathensis goyatoka TaxID=3034132 RepID=UPI0024B5ECF9|nr:box C/D snoRNA protein 1 [Rhinichthys klamathensis goyatoka]